VACLDTTFLIDLAGGTYQERAFSKLSDLIRQGQILTTTRFNVAELYVGITRSSNVSKEEKVVERLLENIAILEFDNNAAWAFGQITAYLMKIGKPAGDMDVLIAATSIIEKHTLITRNTAHFCNIPQLTVEGY